MSKGKKLDNIIVNCPMKNLKNHHVFIQSYCVSFFTSYKNEKYEKSSKYSVGVPLVGCNL